MSYTQYYSGLAAGVGEALQTARASSETQGDLVVQARAMRAEVSSVSLDEEAAHLLEYQRCYQATARLITTLNEMTQVTIDMMR
jgi:flagellar hook-associated protein 1 FlgK